MRDKMNKRYIYALINTITKKIFYVGQTSNPTRRFAEHLLDDSSNSKAQVIQELLAKNILIDFVILQEVTEETATHFEESWIKFLLEHETELTNTAMPSVNYVHNLENKKLLNEFSIEMSYTQIANKILRNVFDIEEIYFFGIHRFSMIKDRITKNLMVIEFVPSLTKEQVEQFLAKLSIEAVSKREKELLKYIKKSVKSITTTGFQVEMKFIMNVIDDHIDVLQDSISGKCGTFFDVVLAFIESSSNKKQNVNALFEIVCVFTELFNIFTEFQLRTRFDEYLENYFRVDTDDVTVN